MVYLMAFVLLNQRQALQFSLIYLGLGLLVGIFGLLFSPPLGTSAINTLSIGVACYRHGDTIASILSRADEAMYRAKATGRNQVGLEEQLEDVIAPAHTTIPDEK